MTGLDLVAGGAGFIGSHVAEALLASGRRVRIADDLSTGRRRNLEGLEADFLEGDLADPEVAAAACRDVERIFHLAARPSVPWSVEHPEASRRANYKTTTALIAAAAAAGVRRIVFSSSSAVYGDSARLPKHEDLEPAPKSPYAEHKLAGERALRAAAGRVEAVCLRYFNVYGPRQDPASPYSGVIALFAGLAGSGGRARIHGDGNQTRDFVFVADVVRANLLAAGVRLASPAPVLNIARGERVTILELWEQVCAAAGVACPEPEFLPPRPGDVRDSLADVRAAERMLGFRAQVALDEGLRRTLAG